MNTSSSCPHPIPRHDRLTILAEEVVWNGRFPLQRIRFRRRFFDGREGQEQVWELWRRGKAVAVLPWDPWTDRVALIEQLRLPALAAGLDPVMTECPAGLLEAHEDPLTAARRELAEETGLTADRLHLIGHHILAQGGSDEAILLYLARVRLPVPGFLGIYGTSAEQEDIRVTVFETEDALTMVDDNRINNATCAIALLWLARHRPRLQGEWQQGE